MDAILRGAVNEEYCYSGYVVAGDSVFLTFCVGNVGQSVEAQVEGALDDMAGRLAQVGLTLEDMVQVDVLMRHPWNLPVMESVFRRRFAGKYPARKTICTEFAHVGGPQGLHGQIDGIAYRGRQHN